MENDRVLPPKDEQSDIIRELRDVPPNHYLFKIKNFSHICNAMAENFESAEFSVGGYNWKLSLYPKGNNKVNETDHISLYLVLCKSKGFIFQQEVNVCLKLIVYNQILDKYLAVQDAKGVVSGFRGMKRERGFDKLVPLSVFNDPSNGYLINDCCVFGAEVFVLYGSSKGECASAVKEHDINSYTWEIEDFAELEEGAYFSEQFALCGYKWKLEFHPNGFCDQQNKRISAYLALEDILKPGRSLYVEYVLRVRDQINGNHHERSDRHRFSPATSECRGFVDLIPLSKLNDPSMGYITNGATILEVQLNLITKDHIVPRTNRHKNAYSCKELCVASKGCFVVYSSDLKRFAIPLSYLNSQVFQKLFEMSKEEFGLPKEGPIRIPCNSVFIEFIVINIHKGIMKKLENTLKCSSQFSTVTTYLQSTVFLSLENLQIIVISCWYDQFCLQEPLKNTTKMEDYFEAQKSAENNNELMSSSIRLSC